MVRVVVPRRGIGKSRQDLRGSMKEIVKVWCMSSCKMRPRAYGCEVFCGSCVTGGEDCVRERAKKGYCVLAVLFVIEVLVSSYVEVVLPVCGEMCCRWTSGIAARSCVRSWAKVEFWRVHVRKDVLHVHGELCCRLTQCVVRLRHRQQG